jgi:hypothetical protein
MSSKLRKKMKNPRLKYLIGKVNSLFRLNVELTRIYEG